MSLRSAVKGAAERALVWSGAAKVHRRRLLGDSLIVAYHNVVPDGTAPSGDLANHLPLSSFAAQLTALRKTHDVVPLPEVLAPASGRSGRPRAAITFDDAYQGAVVHAVAELDRQRLPATIFVAPAFIGGRSFWWDALASPGGGGLDATLRDRALGELQGKDASVRAWAAAHGLQAIDVPPVACAASEDELLRAASTPGITLGSHTWSHPNLARLAPEELANELSKPMAWLRARVPAVLPWLAYPYGYFDDGVQKAAAAAGYTAALAVSGGWVRNNPTERFALPRVNIPPGLSIHGFVLRGAGLLAD